MEEKKQRATAYKLRIGSIIGGRAVTDAEGRLNYFEINNKRVLRTNIVASIIDRYESEDPEKKYLSFTIDDGSGQIRLKIFGDDVDKYKEFSQGDTVMVIGMLRVFNNETYIIPEIIKKQDPKYLLVRKLELEGESENIEISKEEVKALRDQLIDMIKGAEADGGIEIDKLIMELKTDPEIINKEIQKILEEGLAYEPKPGKIRYLG